MNRKYYLGVSILKDPYLQMSEFIGVRILEGTLIDSAVFLADSVDLRDMLDFFWWIFIFFQDGWQNITNNTGQKLSGFRRREEATEVAWKRAQRAARAAERRWQNPENFCPVLFLKFPIHREKKDSQKKKLDTWPNPGYLAKKTPL